MKYTYTKSLLLTFLTDALYYTIVAHYCKTRINNVPLILTILTFAINSLKFQVVIIFYNVHVHVHAQLIIFLPHPKMSLHRWLRRRDSQSSSHLPDAESGSAIEAANKKVQQ